LTTSPVSHDEGEVLGQEADQAGTPGFYPLEVNEGRERFG
jgi:hypothetical protein